MIPGNRQKSKILIAVGREETGRDDVREVLRCKDSIERVFAKKNIDSETLFIEKEDFKCLRSFKKKILDKNPFCIFNLFEGFSDDSEKEAEFAKLLEEAKIKFTGNPHAALSVCLDKLATKRILKRNNLPVARGFLVKNGRIAGNNLIFPLFVKPRREDASVGIDKDSLVNNERELLSVIKKRLKHFPAGLVVEEFLPGKEYSVAFLGRSRYEVVGISEIDYSKHKRFLPFLTYGAKWNKKVPEYRAVMPDYNAKINAALRKSIISLSTRAAKALGCRGYFRVDLRENSGKVFIIDVNPNPDINQDSGYFKLAHNGGYTYEDVVERIVRLSNHH
jgi:D-alanine-D-alanine ligase